MSVSRMKNLIILVLSIMRLYRDFRRVSYSSLLTFELE